MLTVEIELRAVLPAIPDRPHCANVVPQPGPGRRPLHAEAAIDVPLYLRAEPQGEPAARQLLQAPGAMRGNGRTAREGDRNRGGERSPARRLRRQRHYDVRVFLGLLGDNSVIAKAFGEPRILADPGDIER